MIMNDLPAPIRRIGLYGSYGYGYEYKSALTIAGWPLLHISGGMDPVTMRPRIARGIIAIGNVAVGTVAIGGVACGLIAIGGCSLGVLAAVGGVALGAGLSVGGVAVGAIAIGGVAIGALRAVGDVAYVVPSDLLAAISRRSS
jgi:hypothetical protein